MCEGIILPLTIEELEEGARLLERGAVDCESFWQSNGAAFSRTLLVAMRETSDALSCKDLPLDWRDELEGQLELLRRCFDANLGVVGRA
ncbi:MAG TPA: hypothetical protein VFH89_01980 [Sphingomicrobium sp.]|nr:hypothetical protein [Sphingomicrobium sp.]